jgi:hypothetical protein
VADRHTNGENTMLSENVILRQTIDRLHNLADAHLDQDVQHLIKVVRVLWHQVERLERVISVSGDEIILKTGGASIVMKKDGTIDIKGKDIAVTASGRISVKAGSELTLKGSKILQN